MAKVSHIIALFFELATAILALFYIVLWISGTSLEDAREANWVGGKNDILHHVQIDGSCLLL